MTWRQTNKSSLGDGTDIYRCTLCGFKKRYQHDFRDSICPRCLDTGLWGKQAEVPIAGYWSSYNTRAVCTWCGYRMVEVPKKGHPNSHYWKLRHRRHEVLVCCPRGCAQDGSHLAGTRIGNLFHRVFALEKRFYVLLSKLKRKAIR